MKEVGAIKELLGINGKQGIQEHDRGPKPGRSFDERKEQLRSKKADTESEEHKEDGVADKQGQKLHPEVTPGGQTEGIKRGIRT